MEQVLGSAFKVIHIFESAIRREDGVACLAEDHSVFRLRQQRNAIHLVIRRQPRNIQESRHNRDEFVDLIDDLRLNRFAGPPTPM